MTDSLIGTQVGSYEVVQKIGTGGMSVVYLGLQRSIGARVALKVFARHLTDADTTERFFAEARAANLIRHERIVNVLDLVILDDGSPCMVMEYLEGASLKNLLRHRGALPLGSAAKLISEVLDGLAAAHACGVIHRDLRPDNIFITPLGHAKLLDFGVAKFREGPTAQMTMPGELVGTFPYMSPEQLRGKAIDARSDVFATGIVLHEACTGKRLFKGSDVFALLAQQETLPSPAQGRPDMPAALEEVIMRALAIKADQRYSSARAMKESLDQALLSLPGDAFSPLHSSDSSQTLVATKARSPAKAQPLPRHGETLATVDHRGRTPSQPVEPARTSTTGRIATAIAVLALTSAILATAWFTLMRSTAGTSTPSYESASRDAGVPSQPLP